VRTCAPSLAGRTREEALLRRETELWARGYRRVAGVDEAGRGPLAGPVVAAAVVLAPGVSLPGVDDSKVLSPGVRSELAVAIRERAVAAATGAASPREIDRVGIAAATFRAMTRALERLEVVPDFVLVDGRRIPFLRWPQEARPRADSSMLSVAAASILAKVARDRLMERLDARYPHFGFARHKGYGTPDHLEALRLHGPSPWHRLSFAWPGREAAPARPAAEGRAAATRMVGIEGEEIAARYLEGLGFRLVERNFRAAGAEVDLIAWDGSELVFVEVKLRRSARRGEGSAAVVGEKQRRLSRAAASYLARQGLEGSPCRFDVVSIMASGGVGRSPRVDHYRNAFFGASRSLW